MEDVENELMQLIDNMDQQQLVTLLEELQGKDCKHLIGYIISLLSA
jgi:hypothetical protein